MSQENVEIVRQSSDAWARGDLETAYADWHPDIEWHTTHFEAWLEKEVYRGQDEVRAFLHGDWLAGWDNHEARVEKVLDAGDRVVVFWWQRMLGRGSGVPVELKSAQVCTVRDGKITRIENYTDRTEALEAAGLSEQDAHADS